MPARRPLQLITLEPRTYSALANCLITPTVAVNVAAVVNEEAINDLVTLPVAVNVTVADCAEANCLVLTPTADNVAVVANGATAELSFVAAAVNVAVVMRLLAPCVLPRLISSLALLSKW